MFVYSVGTNRVKLILEYATKAQSGIKLRLYSFFNLGAR